MKNEQKQMLVDMSESRILNLTEKLKNEITLIKTSTSPEDLTKIQANCNDFFEELNKELKKVQNLK